MLYKLMEEANEDGAASGTSQNDQQNDVNQSADGVENKEGTNTHQEEQNAAVRPDFVPEKFWNEEKKEVNIEALVTSQKDFEKQARSKQNGTVPTDASEYKITLPEGMEANLDDDPIVKSCRDTALKFGLSVEAFDGFMGELVKLGIESKPETLDKAEEKAKLGERADTIIETVNKWADRLSDVGLFSEDERKAIATLEQTADGVKALNKLRAHYTRAPEIPVHINTDDGAMSQEEYYSAVHSDRYATDKDYRAKVKEHGRRIFGTEPAGTSKAGLGVK